MACAVAKAGSDFTVLQGQGELIWSPYRDLDLGVSVSYTRVNPRGGKEIDSVAGVFRARRSFNAPVADLPIRRILAAVMQSTN